MTRRLPVVAGLLGLLALAGCVNFERQYPQKQTFILDVARPQQAPPAAAGILWVERIRVVPAFLGKNFVYRTGELAYEPDYYSEFLVDPGTLFKEATVRLLAAAGLFREVLGKAGPREPDYYLSGTVSELYGDFRPGVPAKAVLAIDFTLERQKTARTETLLRRRYRREIPLAERTPAALARGWNEALGQILGQFAADLRKQGLPERGK